MSKRFWAAMAPKSKTINHILDGPHEPTTPASMFGPHLSTDPTVWVEILLIPRDEIETFLSNQECDNECQCCNNNKVVFQLINDLTKQ